MPVWFLVRWKFSKAVLCWVDQLLRLTAPLSSYRECKHKRSNEPVSILRNSRCPIELTVSVATMWAQCKVSPSTHLYCHSTYLFAKSILSHFLGVAFFDPSTTTYAYKQCPCIHTAVHTPYTQHTIQIYFLVDSWNHNILWLLNKLQFYRIVQYMFAWKFPI